MIDEVMMATVPNKLKNYLGHTINGNRVIGYGGRNKTAYHWIMECGLCGSEYRTSASCLASKSTNGCMSCAMRRSSFLKAQKVNLIGQRFERLVVISIDDYVRNNTGMLYRCMCDCGNEFTARETYLKKGGVKSCGCYNRDMSKINFDKHRQEQKKNRKPLQERREGNKIRERSEFTKPVRDRANYTCEICGQQKDYRPGLIQAHHLESYSTNIDGRFDPYNGICLCRGCHRAFHKQYGLGNNTKEQFEEFRKHFVCKTFSLNIEILPCQT